MQTTSLLTFLSVLLLTHAQSSHSENPTTSAARSLYQNNSDQVDSVTFFVYAVMFLGMFGIGIFLIYRCYKKSQEREKMKKLMKQKRYDFATSMGMNLQQLDNDSRHNYVVHI